MVNAVLEALDRRRDDASDQFGIDVPPKFSPVEAHSNECLQTKWVFLANKAADSFLDVHVGAVIAQKHDLVMHLVVLTNPAGILQAVAKHGEESLASSPHRELRGSREAC